MDLYDEVALTTPPYTCVVEVGVAFGRSLLYLADRIKRTGKDIRVVAVDPWLDYSEHHFIYHPETATNEGERHCAEFARAHGGSIYSSFTWALYESGLSDIVDVIRAPSPQAAALFREPGMRQVSFVFIDGYHVQDAVTADLDAWWALDPEWMAGDDYNPGNELDFPGVWKAVHNKFGAHRVGRRQTTSWVMRRTHEWTSNPMTAEAERPWIDPLDPSSGR
jgi:Methyltransferase domain